MSNNYNKRSFKTRAFIFLFKLFCASFILGAFFLFVLILWFSKGLPSADKLIERDVALSTKIYDRTGETVLYDVHGTEKRTMIDLDDIPQFAKNATITAEDRAFYEHHGFKLTGIIRAAIKNLTKGTLYGQGGSTITQQLVKNAILSPEKTYTRKLKELVLSYRIEKEFKKDQILKMYFNEIPYGSTVYGIEAAAQTFFSKKASELSLAEATILAALPKAPTYYSPYGNNKDKLIIRQQYILDEMSALGYITEEDLQVAKEEELNFSPLRDNIIAPHFVMYVKELLAEKYGEEFIQQGGLTVITSLDLDKQKKAEEAIENGMELVSELGGSNGALTAIDPKTGQILAMVGSKNYFDIENDGNFNVAIAKRQPGSSFKPMVYTALLEKGYTSETILFDLVTNFNPYPEDEEKNYIPHNYDSKERGPVTVRQSLQGSLNIPAVKALYLAGVNNVLNLAEKMGYNTFGDRDRFGLSLVLGGGEVKLLEHVAAYGILAREGIKHPTVVLLKVENKSGIIIEEYKDEQKRILGAETVRKINNILSDDNARSYVFGTGSNLTLQGRPVCAKTGTTNDYRDAWTIGYTPSLVAGVWVGNNDNTEMARGAGGIKAAAPIWNDFMMAVLGSGDKDDSTPVENFSEPLEDIAEKPILNGVGLYEKKVNIDKKTGQIANDFCPDFMIEERIYSTIHSILFYVDKNNPRGEWPQNPDRDPQFNGWESAVLAWASTTKEVVLGAPPTEKCHLHNLENKPFLKIIYPNNKDKISSQSIDVRVDASAPRGINHIDYYIDNLLVKSVNAYPFGLNYPSIKVSNGFHTISVKPYDDVGNYNVASIEINLMAERQPVQSYFETPRHNGSFFSSSFPLTYVFKISDQFNTQNIKVFYKKEGEQETFIRTYNGIDISSDTFEFKWGDNPSAGAYSFYVDVTDKKNRVQRGQELKIRVLE